MRGRFLQAAFGTVLCLLAASVARAQTPQAPATGKLIITVVDQMGGVLPNATVTVAGLDAAAKASTIAPVKTTEKGVATLDKVSLGHYSVSAEFPGFDPNGLKDINVKAGDNKHVVVLALKRMSEEVTVTQDKQDAGSSRDTFFGSALTREQIDALSDDPTEMQRQLMAMAGQDARIRVDSFEGQELPQKAQIKSIHITRDQFAAESHFAGGTFIDIITQPGIGPLRTNLGGSFHNNAMEAKNPLAPAKGPAQNYNWRGGLGGALIKDKAQFSISGNQSNSYTTPNLYAATPTGGTQSENLNLRTVRNNVGVSGLLDYAVTKDQTIRLSMNGGHNTTDGQGVGNFDSITRATSSRGSSFGMRMTEAGPLGRRFFTNTRFSLTASNSTSQSISEAITINVPGAFTNGGGQRKGGTHSKNFLAASDLDYVRGKNSWRTGIQFEGSHYRSDAISNFNGTYVFESLDAFNANTPRSFTQTIGNPNISYTQLNVGMYVQDDIRLRKNLSLSPGIRYEVQTHLRDYNNLSPRFGATWSPFKSGKTSMRGSWGIFYDWVSAGNYLRTVQNDGTHLLNVNIAAPTFPTVPDTSLGTVSPFDVYRYGPGMAMSRNMRVAFSINQTLTRRTSVSATFSDTHAWNLLVGSNQNTPVLGVRPNPSLANIYVTNPDGRSRTRAMSSNFSLNLGPMPKTSSAGPAPSGGAVMMGREMMVMMGAPAPGAAGAAGSKPKFFQWNRGLYLNGSYYLSKSENDTEGSWSIPSTGNLALEWGPSSFDTRHSVYGGFSSGAFKNVNLSFNASWSSAPPITILTGTDDNGDLIFNDRPAGVGRNSVRTVGSWDTSMYVSYSLGFGKKMTNMPPGIAIMMSGGAMGATTMQIPSQPKYRMGISFSISNLTNHRNPSGFSGIQTSPYFLKPTQFYGQRSASLSFNLSF